MNVLTVVTARKKSMGNSDSNVVMESQKRTPTTPAHSDVDHASRYRS